MNFTIEIELEKDGRWIAEAIDIPGVLVYGQTKEEAVNKVKTLALRVLADMSQHGELTTAARANGLSKAKRVTIEV